jgi:hypothetical protein
VTPLLYLRFGRPAQPAGNRWARRRRSLAPSV